MYIKLPDTRTYLLINYTDGEKNIISNILNLLLWCALFLGYVAMYVRSQKKLNIMNLLSGIWIVTTF